VYVFSLSTLSFILFTASCPSFSESLFSASINLSFTSFNCLSNSLNLASTSASISPLLFALYFSICVTTLYSLSNILCLNLNAIDCCCAVITAITSKSCICLSKFLASTPKVPISSPLAFFSAILV